MLCVHLVSLFIQRIAAASVGQPAYLWKWMLPYLIFSSSLARFTKYLRLGIKDFFLWKKMLYLTPIKDVYQVIGGFLFHPEKAVASQGQNWNHPEIICEPCFGCTPKILQYPTFNLQMNFILDRITTVGASSWIPTFQGCIFVLVTIQFLSSPDYSPFFVFYT